MEVKIIHHRQTAHEFLRDKSRYDYIYQFSNLEERNWENVICFGLYHEEELKQIAMISINYGIPVLLAACHEDCAHNIELLGRIKSFLPPRFYTHIDKKTLDCIFKFDKISDLQEYMNMGYENTEENESNSMAIKIGHEQIEDIKQLLSESYPEAWLDDELVKLNRNFGVFKSGKLISFAGIHAYAEEYQVAAIAHVTTHPDYRRQGYGEAVVESLKNDLIADIRYIGLNVKIDNINAVNCYKKLGFKEFGRFVGCEIEILNKS